MATPTYGVGDGAEKQNVGLAHSQDSVMKADGSVINQDGDTVFDPKDDKVEVKTDDPDIDYAAAVGAPEGDSDSDDDK